MVVRREGDDGVAWREGEERKMEGGPALVVGLRVGVGVVLVMVGNWAVGGEVAAAGCGGRGFGMVFPRGRGGRDGVGGGCGPAAAR